MPQKASQQGRIKHRSTLKLDSPPPSKKFKATNSVMTLSLSPCSVIKPRNKPPSIPHLSKTSWPVTAITKDAKGKGKVTRDVHAESSDDRLWVDKYEPRSLEDLAVHKRKVDDVRRWLAEAFSEIGLSKHRRLLILSGPAGSGKTATLRVLAREMDFEIAEYKNNTNSTQFSALTGEPSTSDTQDTFATFLNRAGSYTSVFTSARRRLVLVEDLPNILHPGIRARFHDTLRVYVERASGVVPVIIVVSDAGLRTEGDSSGGRSLDLVIDARTVVPPGLPDSLFSEIRFNPIALTLITSAVRRVMDLANVRLSPSALHTIVEGAGGDVRSGIMTLEFSCGHPKSRKQSTRLSVGSIVLVTQREEALLLFHLVGKIMYNKRKGDSPSRSASRKDIARDRALDQSLKDPPPLPLWLAAEERRTSRVDVDALFTSTPIDASLFGLYIHQNYTQYCTNLEQCNSNGPENWYDANPHAFHIRALGTLHSLPSPVSSTGQRIYKPAFFDALQRERGARDALDYTSNWLSSTRLWPLVAMTTELGGILRVLGRRAPHGHHTFSELVFGRDSVGAKAMTEGDVEGGVVDYDEGETRESHYLEDDDIEDW
ncbi:Rad17 cell cycle checkpoint protein-domain-containing protein [Multifurca ochricompacta]|uniref:Rad17 cell cycle checkpoint protein-domain-containing protein n=1 Tax=Multifurca ochricompacta TaxID=376703 RepID=A0AAD4M551_9AGAM|nr:Rad17 cell cycle checkpoint protein-domain-containing protein [Multifurca ochricompacta]